MPMSDIAFQTVEKGLLFFLTANKSFAKALQYVRFDIVCTDEP